MPGHLVIDDAHREVRQLIVGLDLKDLLRESQGFLEIEITICIIGLDIVALYFTGIG